ncbi:MAG: EpsG family protein [Candidatus Arsenophonus phytopathogenicus]
MLYYYLLFIIYYLLFIIYYLLFIIYYLLFIIYYLLFIILVIRLRYELGVDWLFYRNLFNGNNSTLSIEPGYKLLPSFISFLGFDFCLFVCMISIFILLVLSHFFKNYSPFPLFCLSIYFISSFGFNVEALRQIIAVAIFYIALNYYLNNKKKHYIILCLLASSFHMSAMLLLILPFIDGSLFKRLMKISVLIGLIMSVMGLYPIETILATLTLLPDNSYLEKVLLYSLPVSTSNAFSFNLLFKILIISLRKNTFTLRLSIKKYR